MMGVDKHIQNVINILKKEYDYYKDLLDMADKKKDIIIEGKVSELDKLVKLEQNMIFDIGQLEKAREQETDQICSELNIDRKAASISELSKKLETKYNKELDKLQNQLSSILEGLKSANELNSKLIQQSLEYIDYSINIITSVNSTTSSLYDDIDIKGTTDKNKKRLFDTKI